MVFNLNSVLNVLVSMLTKIPSPFTSDIPLTITGVCGIRSGDWTDVETNIETTSRSREKGRHAVKDLLEMNLKKDNVKVRPVSVSVVSHKNKNNKNIDKYSSFFS